jgi:hypothetical protein
MLLKDMSDDLPAVPINQVREFNCIIILTLNN